MDSVSNFTQHLILLEPALRAFARSLCADRIRADDLVQETMLRAWTARHQFQSETNLKAWLFTILRNCHYSDFRQRKLEVDDPDGIFASRMHCLMEHDKQLEIRDIRRALQLLPVDQREAIVLVFSNGMSYAEAASKCGCPVGTIRSRIARARTKLSALVGASECSADADPL